jgi:hypothetical protein
MASALGMWRRGAWCVAAAALVLSSSGVARAQEGAAGGGRVGGPIVPTLAERSGVISRHLPIAPTLPHDRDRDDFYQTRRGDHPPRHYNWYATSGMYGLPLKNDCVVSFAPFFRGSPGGKYGECCEPHRPRVIGNLVHPWRPVYSYYSGGSYAPVYDLDPIVPGPGPFPFPLWYKKQHQGG